jgi:hypothetical protein
MADGTRFNHVAPHMAVEDVAAGVRFFIDVLGFETDYGDGEPLRYAVVRRDEVYVHLSRPTPDGWPPGPGCAFLSVQGIDDLYKLVQDHNHRVEVVEALADRDFGHGVRLRTFTIRAPEGNVLRIGQPMP